MQLSKSKECQIGDEWTVPLILTQMHTRSLLYSTFAIKLVLLNWKWVVMLPKVQIKEMLVNFKF